MSVGQRLRKTRESKGLSQKEAAIAIGLSNVVLNRYENDERLPDIETLGKMASYYDVTTDYLLELTDTSRPVTDESPFTEFVPTPPERIRTFYKKVGELSPESLSLLEEQTEHLLRLEREVLARRTQENDKQ